MSESEGVAGTNRFPAGGGEAGALIRAIDWSGSPLGAPETWPQSLRSVVDLLLASKFPMFVAWGPDLGFLYNDPYAEILGAKHPAAMGRPFQEIWAEIWPDISPLIDSALAGEATFRENLPLVMNRRGFDEPTWFTFSYSPVTDESGRIAGMFCACTETTGEIVAESALRASEKRFRDFADHAPVMMWVTDPSGHCNYLNRGWYEFTGQTRAQAEGFGWLDAIHPDDRAEAERVFVEANERQAPFRLEYRLRRADGVFRWAIDAAAPRFDPDGDYLGYVGSVIDIDERRSMEAALRASETRYRTLFESIESGFCVVEVDLERADGRIDYRVIEANPAFYRQTGFPETILGRWLREAAPELEEEWYEIYGRVARTREAERFEQGSKHLGRWFDVFAFPTEGEPGRRVGILFHDISMRRNAELALKQSEERLRLATDNSEIGLWDVDVTGDRMVWPPRVKAMFGISADMPVTMRDFYEGLHPEDRERTAAAFAAAVNPDIRALYDVEYRTVGKEDGIVRWIAAKGRAMFDENNLCVRVIGTAVDISARKAIEEELRELNETLEQRVVEAVTERMREHEKLNAAEAARREADALYRAYFQNSPEALFVIAVGPDGDFVVEETNPAHEAGLGLSQDAVRDRRIEELLPAEAAAKVLESYRKVVESGTILQYREIFTLDGDPQHWDTSLVPVRGPDGRIARLIGSSRNVTRQVIAEEALRDSQKMEAMGQLTGGVAHDFNNLLTPIIGSLDMLQRKGLGGDREQRLIAGAMQSAERAKTLVQRLLAFARRQPLQSIAVDVTRLVKGMGDLVRSTTGPQIKVIVEAAEGLPAARADPNQLEMALLNLAVNARDAMSEGGTLRISADAQAIGAEHPTGLAPGRYVRLSVADTGEGMDEATLARAVEPFFSTKGIGKGTGLGLSMVHGLASQLGGALALHSRPGLGTNVELWLPQSESEPEAAESGSDAPAVPAGHGTALLVDDEELVRLSTADMLSDLGYRVIEAASAEEAIRMIGQGERFDLLVTDHLMPGMNGTDLARMVRGERPDLPVLLVSGYAESEGISADLPRLVKPFRKDELAASLLQLTGRG